jgi:hypothetical protein
MDELRDFSDERHKAWCIHCNGALKPATTNKDHVPSKSLLDQPFPPNLPLVLVCVDCNTSFSENEQYLVAFLGSVLRGTTDPNLHEDTAAKRILRWNSSLRASIEQARREYRTVAGETRLLWQPDEEKINKALTKNARGHVYHELGEPIFGDPTSAWSKPLEHFHPEDRDEFERSAMPDLWLEIGCRLMTRLLSGQDLDGSWIVVQPGVYRFNIHFGTPIRVRMILREYLAAEVTWSD